MTFEDFSDQLTVFVLTVGDEPNFSECMAALATQTARFKCEQIVNVAPLSAAMQQMIEQCTTPYFVQVDEDMLLYPHAVQHLFESITATSADVALVCAPLWDCHMRIPLHGVKAYRRDIVLAFPYRDTFSAEWTQVCELRANGYRVHLVPLEERLCIGQHGRHFTNTTAYVRYLRLAQKHRMFNHMPWLLPWAQDLITRVVREDALQQDVYAFFGLVAGLTGPVPSQGEQDFRQTRPELDRLARWLSK